MRVGERRDHLYLVKCYMWECVLVSVVTSVLICSSKVYSTREWYLG